MALVMAELDPAGTGECTLAMLKKHWPADWKEAIAVVFHAAAVTTSPALQQQRVHSRKESERNPSSHRPGLLVGCCR